MSRTTPRKQVVKIALAMALPLGALPACQTTSNSVASVDKTRGEVSLYSTGDKRSTLAEPAKFEAAKETEESLKQFLRTNRNDVESILALAQVQVAEGEFDAAEKNCFTALRLDLRNRDARKVLAQIALRRGNYDLASIFLNGAGGEQSKDSGVLNMLAMIELSRSNNAGAMALFKRAIQINGNDMAARMNLGVLLLKYRQLAQAAVEFERVLKAVPNHSDAKLHLAIIMAARGQADDARKMFEEVLASDDKNPLALYNLAVLQRDTAHYDEALENLKGYLKGTRGKPADNDQVFALIDDIQKNQVDKGQQVSDEEIQMMASQVGKGGAPVAKAGDGDGVADGDKAPDAAPTATAAAPAATAAVSGAPTSEDPTLKIPEGDDTPASGGDEIGDLEKALAH